MRKFRLFVLIALLGSLCGVLSARVRVPIAEARPETLTVHYMSLIDNWAWLSDREDPALKDVLKAEERYANTVMRPSRRLGKNLLKEFRRFEAKNFRSFPYKLGNYLYFYRQPSNRAYAINYRREDRAGAKDELILDENRLARRKAYFHLDQYKVSPDGRYLAYTTDTEGDENYRLFIMELSTKRSYDTGITEVSECVWRADNQTLLIARNNSQYRTDTIWSYNRSSRVEELIFTERNPAFNLGLYQSRAKDLIFLVSASKNTTDVRFIASRGNSIDWRELTPRRTGHVFYPDYYDGLFYIQSNHLSPDGSIFVCSELNTNLDSWRVIVPGVETHPINDFLIFEDALVVKARHQGFERFEIYDRRGNGLLYSLPVQESSDFSFWVNENPLEKHFLYTRENELRPPGIVRHSFVSRSDSLIHEYAPPREYFPERFRTELRMVRLPSGKSIPLRLIYRRDLDLSKPQPLLLSAYGAYGDSEDPYFSTANFSLLQRGLVMATAHVRGGGEFGKSWYDGGRLLDKMNSFTDFIACMDYLIAQNITSPSKLAISGGSAGGLLVGAVVNMAPQKFKIALADVPFVDLINTMLDPDLPLTQLEYEEWGDPTDRETFQYMLTYSPYDNITPGNKPEVLISAGWMDTRVGYWEGLKWAQKLRSQNRANTHIIYRLMQDEGHGGSGNRIRNLENYSKNMAYTLWLLGIRK